MAVVTVVVVVTKVISVNVGVQNILSQMFSNNDQPQLLRSALFDVFFSIEFIPFWDEDHSVAPCASVLFYKLQ